MDKNTNTNYGIGATGLLGVAFVVLKLCHVINWSWWWVTAPFWIPVVFVLLFGIILALIAAFTKSE